MLSSASQAPPLNLNFGLKITEPVILVSHFETNALTRYSIQNTITIQDVFSLPFSVARLQPSAKYTAFIPYFYVLIHFSKLTDHISLSSLIHMP